MEISMTSGTDVAGREMQGRIMRYLEDTPGVGRVLITLHTHADVSTGELCCCHADDGVTALYSTIGEILSFNLGEEVRRAMKAHTAQRGLVLIACGPTMAASHSNEVRELVRE